jgi:hypothetical protein
VHQVSESELDANLSQLAELVPVEIVDGEHCHGMVYGNVTVAYINEKEFMGASEEDRARVVRRAYLDCLRGAIENTVEHLDEMAGTGYGEQFKHVAKQIVASLKQGHTVLDHDNPGLEDCGEDGNE